MPNNRDTSQDTDSPSQRQATSRRGFA
ncbi:MAG: hypothetical protein JWP77_563, partial [Polaromonas sp.]|nr:hypothetical protein [Polaromonas sp.]